MEFKLENGGFITKYLYAGKKETKIDVSQNNNIQIKNQLQYEKYLRGQIVQHQDCGPEEDIRLGENSRIGMPWQYYYSHGNMFLDVSAFYLELHRVELAAAVELVANRDMEIELQLWSYDAVTLWINNQIAGRIEKPVYKPIQQLKLKAALKKGNNPIYILLETLGVRDTRIGFALQILSNPGNITVTLPDAEGAERFVEAGQILDSVQLKGGRLWSPKPFPRGSYLLYNKENPDFYKRVDNQILQEISKDHLLVQEIKLQEYASFSVNIPIENSVMSRRLERIELRKPAYLPETEEGHIADVLRKIADVTSMTRSKTDGFALYPMLARLLLGISGETDQRELQTTVLQIERRVDCADFMTCALVRILKKYDISEDIRQEVRRVMLSFRYWMDEDGQDAMCFWSENHSLMFYQTAYFFGQEYPRETFIRSGRRGEELYRKAKARLTEWLTDVCEYGFDEFNSGVYGVITLAALLNLVDYAEESIALLARKAADEQLRRMALHCFQGVVMAPQGRIYRDVIYPYRQSLQGLVNYADREAPYVFNEWLAVLADSTYEVPADFRERMKQQGLFRYSTSNAVIELYKTDLILLTSVQSPRRDGINRVWQADFSKADQERFLYTKSLNECFHGTTQFEPGVLGYQQHLWYAALSADLVVFTNHPGATCEDMAECRPGYWFGNGIMPALRQEKNILGIIYVIPDTQPVKFTHVFWEAEKFDKTCRPGNWLLGSKGDSYIGLWCNVPMMDFDDVLFNCEKRNYGNKTAYLCVMGTKQEEGSFEAFEKACRERRISFSEKSNTLYCDEFILTYEGRDNASQYID